MESILNSPGLSETPQVPSGNQGVEKAEAVAQQEAIVSYETHKRLLGEKKKLQDRLEQVETQWKAKTEQEMKAQNQYKELYESTLKDRESLNSKLGEQEKRWNDAIKLDSFMQSMGSRKIEPKYASFINLDGILLDPESGSIDSVSVQREVDRICREYPEIIKGAVQVHNMPGDPPRNPLLHGSDSLRPKSSKEKLLEAASYLAKPR